MKHKAYVLTKRGLYGDDEDEAVGIYSTEKRASKAVADYAKAEAAKGWLKMWVKEQTKRYSIQALPYDKPIRWR